MRRRRKPTRRADGRNGWTRLAETDCHRPQSPSISLGPTSRTSHPPLRPRSGSSTGHICLHRTEDPSHHARVPVTLRAGAWTVVGAHRPVVRSAAGFGASARAANRRGAFVVRGASTGSDGVRLHLFLKLLYLGRWGLCGAVSLFRV